MIGPQFDFGSDELRALYGDRDGYLSELRARVEELVEERWYLAEDAEEVLREAEAIPA